MKETMSPMVDSEPTEASPRKKPRKTSRTRPAPDATLALAQRVADLMLEKKADDVTVLSVGALTSFADYFVLGTCQSDRQVQALGRHLGETMKHEGNPALSTEGEAQSHWVLIDFGGVVAHIFYQPARAYYDLDGLWADAPRVDIEDSEAHRKAAVRRQAALGDEDAPARKPRTRKARGDADA